MVDINENGKNQKRIDEVMSTEVMSAEVMNVDIDISLWEDYDVELTKKYLERLFNIADKLGKSLHDEKLNVGEAILIIYMLEKGALETMKSDIDENIDKSIDHKDICEDDVCQSLISDNKQRIDFIANMIFRNKMEKMKK